MGERRSGRRAVLRATEGWSLNSLPGSRLDVEPGAVEGPLNRALRLPSSGPGICRIIFRTIQSGVGGVGRGYRSTTPRPVNCTPLAAFPARPAVWLGLRAAISLGSPRDRQSVVEGKE